MSRCPRCKVPTSRVEYEGASVRMCGRCGGYWVTQIALKAIAHRRDTEFTEAVKERFLQLADESNSTEPLMCMSCGKFMVKDQFKDWDDIVIDRCEKCGGIWLDPGELQKIQIYWEYFRDHPEQSNLDAIAKRALLESEMDQRVRDVKEARERMREVAHWSRYGRGYMLGNVLRTLFGR